MFGGDALLVDALFLKSINLLFVSAWNAEARRFVLLLHAISLAFF